MTSCIPIGKQRRIVFRTYDNDGQELYDSSLKDCLIEHDGRLLVLFLYASNEEMRLVR